MSFEIYHEDEPTNWIEINSDTYRTDLTLLDFVKVLEFRLFRFTFSGKLRELLVHNVISSI